MYTRILLITLSLLSIISLKAQWTPLFNGKDFSGWDTYLRSPEGSKDSTPIGFNKDPHHVFTMNDGIIRISGQDWGAIISKKQFSNYHLRFSVKFGEKKWPPRENLLRDGGLMFHSSGPQNYGYRCWMRSNEMQIQETEIGDFFNAGEGTCEFTVTPITIKGEETDSEVVEQYDPHGIIKRYNDRVYRSGNFENPHGQWSTGELIARGADAVFIVNGHVVNRLYNTFREDLRRQTTSGQLQFQSESAEYFLKDVQIRPISFHPSGISRLMPSVSSCQLSVTPKIIDITNRGDEVEIIAIELIGKNTEQVSVGMPAWPRVIRHNETFQLHISQKAGSIIKNPVQLRLETVLGPLQGFEVTLSPAP